MHNDTSGKFAAGVVGTEGNLPPALLTPVAILPPVSTTQAELVATLPPVSLILAAILPPVLLTPVVHLDLRISPRISKKFQMTLLLFSGAWGKVIHEKPKAKNLVTMSL